MHKLSEINPEYRQLYIDRINQRWGQLHSLEKEWHEKAWKYLFLTNSGGAVAMLSFLGSAPSATKPYLSFGLFLFLLGLILVGICIAKHYHHIAFLFKEYKTDANKFLADGCCWENVVEQDEKRVTPTCCALFWSYFWPYLSFFSFILGCLIGVYALIFAS